MEDVLAQIRELAHEGSLDEVFGDDSVSAVACCGALCESEESS